MLRAFHHSGWSKVIIGVELWHLAWLHTKSNVEYIQERSPGFKSIMGRKRTDDSPGYFPLCTVSIMPDQDGRGDRIVRDIFQRRSSLEVLSSSLLSAKISYFNESNPVKGDIKWLMLI